MPNRLSNHQHKFIWTQCYSYTYNSYRYVRKGKLISFIKEVIHFLLGIHSVKGHGTTCCIKTWVCVCVFLFPVCKPDKRKDVCVYTCVYVCVCVTKTDEEDISDFSSSPAHSLRSSAVANCQLHIAQPVSHTEPQIHKHKELKSLCHTWSSQSGWK